MTVERHSALVLLLRGAWLAVRALDRVAGLALRLPIWLYQRLVSPVLPPSCRYDPSCSAYASEALRTHGAVVGLYLGTGRLLRCHPWAPGGPDPVPMARTSLWRPDPPAPPHETQGAIPQGSLK